MACYNGGVRPFDVCHVRVTLLCNYPLIRIAMLVLRWERLRMPYPNACNRHVIGRCV